MAVTLDITAVETRLVPPGVAELMGLPPGTFAGYMRGRATGDATGGIVEITFTWPVSYSGFLIYVLHLGAYSDINNGIIFLNVQERSTAGVPQRFLLGPSTLGAQGAALSGHHVTLPSPGAGPFELVPGMRLYGQARYQTNTNAADYLASMSAYFAPRH